MKKLMLLLLLISNISFGETVNEKITKLEEIAESLTNEIQELKLEMGAMPASVQAPITCVQRSGVDMIPCHQWLM